MQATTRVEKALPDDEFKRRIVGATREHPGLTLADVLIVVGLPKWQGPRALRVLTQLCEEGELERWQDHNERPFPEWRYWIRGVKPEEPGPRTPLEPSAPAAPPEGPEPVRARSVAPRESVAPPPPPPEEAPPPPVAKQPKKERAPAQTPPPEPAAEEKTALDRLWDDARAHPGTTSGEAKARTGISTSAVGLSQLLHAGRVRREGDAKPYRYFALDGAPSSPRPGPKPREKGEPHKTVTRDLVAYVKRHGRVSSATISDKWGKSGLSIAAALARDGKLGREGHGRGSAYLHPDAKPRRRAGGARVQKETKPSDGLEEKIARIRAAEAELKAAREDLAADLLGGAQ